jgi:hypothetical protein
MGDASDIHVRPMVVIIYLVCWSKVDSTPKHRHVNALDRLKALIGGSLVLKFADEYSYCHFADESVAVFQQDYLEQYVARATFAQPMIPSSNDSLSFFYRG